MLRKEEMHPHLVAYLAPNGRSRKEFNLKKMCRKGWPRILGKYKNLYCGILRDGKIGKSHRTEIRELKAKKFRCLARHLQRNSVPEKPGCEQWDQLQCSIGDHSAGIVPDNVQGA